MSVGNYKTILYGQEDGSWVAEIPAIRVAMPSCPAGKKLSLSLAAFLK